MVKATANSISAAVVSFFLQIDLSVSFISRLIRIFQKSKKEFLFKKKKNQTWFIEFFNMNVLSP